MSTTVHPQNDGRRRRLRPGLLLMVPAIAAAFLFSATPSPVELVKSSSELVALAPPGHRDEPDPAPSPGGSGPASKDNVWDIFDYDACVKATQQNWETGEIDSQRYLDDLVFCCTQSGGEWSTIQGCTAPAPKSGQPGRATLPATEAVDTPSTQQGGPSVPLPPVAVDPGSAQTPPTTTTPPVTRDHRTQ